jgi:tRNA(Ile)-lysidine synthase
VALLEALLRAGFRDLAVCHLNHRLRGAESDADAAFVSGLARQHGLPCEIGEEDVAARAARERVSLETAGRRARFAWFRECAARQGTDRLFLAHHADDQAETVLVNILRGTGRRGLGGMRPVARVGGLTVIRPFLDTPRERIPVPERFREDPSNADPAFLRNRIRLRVMPGLRDALGRDVRPALCRMAETMRDEEAFLEEVTRRAAEDCAGPEPPGCLRIDRLRALPRAVVRRVLLGWMRGRGIPRIGRREVEAARALVEPGIRKSRANLPGDWRVRRRAGRLFLEPPA